MRSISAILLSFIALTTNALAGKSVSAFVSGNWIGNAFYEDDGRFGWCSITTSYKSGIIVSFALGPTGTWTVGFSQPGGFSNNVQRQLSLYVDGQYVFGAPATRAGKFLFLALPSKVDLFQQLRLGRMLTVVTPGGKAEFLLTGTAAALLEMVECVKRRSVQTTVKAPPGLEPAPRSNADADFDRQHKFTRDEVLTYAANVLATANITGYRFLPYEDTKMLGDVVWMTAAGSFGALMLFKNMPDTIDVDQLSANASKDDAVSCKGDFVSGKKTPRNIGAVEIRKSFSLCKAGENSSSFEYSWMKLPRGVFIRLATGRFGDGAQAGDADAGLSQRSEEAVLTVMLSQ